MNIVEKLLTVSSNNKTVGENAPKVYKAGQLNILKEPVGVLSDVLTNCLNAPLIELQVEVVKQSNYEIILTSDSGEEQRVSIPNSYDVYMVYLYADGSVFFEMVESSGSSEVVFKDYTNTDVGRAIKALHTYEGNTYLSSEMWVKYYKDARIARFEAGQESERQNQKISIERSKQAILGRGGEISADAKIEDLPSAIFNIPVDASLGFYEDSETAYQKIVLKGAEDYALLKQLGGMTYKCNNLIPFPYKRNNNVIEAGYTKTNYGITYTVNADGSIVASGEATDTAVFTVYGGSTFLKLNETYTISGCPSDGNTSTYYISGGLYVDSEYVTSGFTDTGTGATTTVTAEHNKFYIQIAIKKGIVCNDLVFKPMLNYGDTALPYEPYYEGLRDTKVTEIVSKGANLIPFPYLNGNYGELKIGYDYQIDNLTFRVQEDGGIAIDGAASETNNTYFSISNINFSKLYDNYSVGLWDSNGNKLDEGIVGCNLNVKNGLTSVYVLKGKGEIHTVGYPMANIGSPLLLYTPYQKPISYRIPEEVQALEGYGKEGFVIDLGNQTSEYEGNVSPLPVPLEPFIKVEGGGSIEFVNEYKNAVPSTVKYIRKVGA